MLLLEVPMPSLSGDDPRRPLYAGARLMTACGAIHLGFGGLIALAGLGSRESAAAGSVLVAGGFVMLLCGSGARRHRPWAVWCGIATGIGLGAVAAMLLALLVANVGWNDFIRFKSPVVTVLALPLAALAFVHVCIVWNLSAAFEGLRRPPLLLRRAGFSPITPAAPQRVIPIEADDVPPAAG
jgi:hypothetical protein